MGCYHLWRWKIRCSHEDNVVLPMHLGHAINAMHLDYIQGRKVQNRVVPIEKLLRGSWHVKVRHVYREANKVTDAIASLGCQMSNSLLVYDSPPDFVRGLLDDDVRGVATPRLVV